MRLVSFLLCFLIANLSGGQPSPEPLTVDAAVESALRRNPRLSAAAREIVAAEAETRSARARANPALVFVPALTEGGSDEELLLQQPLELNGIRSARSAAAAARLRRTRAEAVSELRDLVFETRSAYCGLARAREQQALALDLLQSAEEFDRIARRQVEVGTRAGVDQIQTGIEVARARAQVAVAEGRAASAAAVLNTRMGRLPSEPVGALSPLSLSESTAPESDAPRTDEAAAITRALSARTEIAAREAVRDAFREEARILRAEGRPDVAPQFRVGRLTRGVEEAGIGIAVTLPFIDYGGRRNRIRQAEASSRAEEDRITTARRQVRLEVSQAFTEIRTAEAVVREISGTLDQARRLLEASRTGFRTGATSIVAVLEAQRAYQTLQSDDINARADLALARAGWERAVGAVPADPLTEILSRTRRLP